jgi:hypothetical protein
MSALAMSANMSACLTSPCMSTDRLDSSTGWNSRSPSHSGPNLSSFWAHNLKILQFENRPIIQCYFTTFLSLCYLGVCNTF